MTTEEWTTLLIKLRDIIFDIGGGIRGGKRKSDEKQLCGAHDANLPEFILTWTTPATRMPWRHPT